MKKIALVAVILLTILSCSKTPNNYITFAGTLKNLKESDTLFTITNKVFKKNITIKNNGTFKDTLTIKKAGYYSLAINGRNYGFVFLRNGFEINLSADKNHFLKTIKLTGKGSSSTNYIIAQYKYGRSLGNPRALFTLEKEAFTKKIKEMKFSFDSIKKAYTELDTMLVRTNDKENSNLFNFLEKDYDQQHELAKKQAAANLNLEKGKPSPKFKNYVNYKGSTSSLDSFKGKYVYIDVWATWCHPCVAEIPALKSLEKKYRSKNIRFVSISIDNASTAGSWDKALTKWKKMVKEKKMAGTQLYAGEDIEFMKGYQITTIPRFILIDPKGNIVNANAPRPSNPSIENLFKEVGI